jgi:hypothetical protein
MFFDLEAPGALFTCTGTNYFSLASGLLGGGGGRVILIFYRRLYQANTYIHTCCLAVAALRVRVPVHTTVLPRGRQGREHLCAWSHGGKSELQGRASLMPVPLQHERGVRRRQNTWRQTEITGRSFFDDGSYAARAAPPRKCATALTTTRTTSGAATS